MSQRLVVYNNSLYSKEYRLVLTYEGAEYHELPKKKEESRNIIIYIFQFIMFPKECL